MWGDIAIAFLLAFIVSFMATPWSIKIAKKIGAVDIPKDDRRMRNNVMPKLGGIAVILGFVLSTVYLLTVMSIEGTIDLFGADEYAKKLVGIFLGIIIIAITGILDDTKDLKPYQKLIGQILAAIVVVAFGTKIDYINISTATEIGLSKEFSTLITIIWIVGITNAITSLGNIGPGITVSTGPMGTFEGVHGISKVIMIVNMLVGRLELIPFLILFQKDLWSLKDN